MNEKPQVLLVSGGEENGLKEILRRRANLAEAGSIPEMVCELAQREFDVIVCERKFSEGTWREALRELQARRVASPAIVVSQTVGVDEGIEEWAEVLAAGAFDLLLAPAREYSVLALIEHAMASGQARALTGGHVINRAHRGTGKARSLAPPVGSRENTVGKKAHVGKRKGDMHPVRVLFLCTGNSCRSQMAEGLLRRIVPPAVVGVASAGTNPKPVHPDAIRTMQEILVDISAQRSKSLDSFLGQEFDYVITLCDAAQEACPTFPGSAKRLHWNLPDPAAAQGTEAERLAAFRAVRNDLATRIEGMLEGILDRLLEKAYEENRKSVASSQ